MFIDYELLLLQLIELLIKTPSFFLPPDSTEMKAVFVSGIHFLRNYFLNFPVFVCFLENWSTENTFRSTKNTFQSNKNLAWFSGKCFSENFGGKHFPEVVKKL